MEMDHIKKLKETNTKNHFIDSKRVKQQ